MRNLILCLLLSAAALSSAAARTDLTPFPVEISKDGFTFQQLVFKADAGRVSYEPPLKWKHYGSASRLVLTPPDKPFAEAGIDVAPVAAGVRLPTPDELVAQVLASLPPGAQTVVIDRQEENSFLLHGNASYEVVVSYQALGEQFQRSVLFITMNDERFVFRMSARHDDFGTLNKSFRRSLGTWRPIAAAAIASHR